MEWDILALALGAWSGAVVVGMALEVQLGWMGKLVALLRRMRHGLNASRREELKRARVRVEMLEEELLAEENRNASGPERLKHGIPTDD